MSAPDTDAPDTDAPVTAPADAENRVHVERDGPVTVATLDAPAYRNSMGAPGIRDGLAANKPRIAFPIGTKAGVWLGSVLPGSWTARLLGAA